MMDLVPQPHFQRGMPTRDHIPRQQRLGDLKVMTWNVLAAEYATKKMFPYVAKNYISLTKHRSHVLEQMIIRLNPDLMALQEVDRFASVWRPMLLKLGYDMVYANRGESESPLIYCSNCPKRQAYYDALLSAQQDTLSRVSRGATANNPHDHNTYHSDPRSSPDSLSTPANSNPTPSPFSPFSPPPSRRKKDGCLIAFRASQLALVLPAVRVDMDELAVDGGWAAWSNRGYTPDGYAVAAVQTQANIANVLSANSTPATSPAPTDVQNTSATPLALPAHPISAPLPRYLRDNIALFLPLLRLRPEGPLPLLAGTTHLFWSPLCEDVKLWQAVFAARVAEALRAVLAAHCSAGPLQLPRAVLAAGESMSPDAYTPTDADTPTHADTTTDASRGAKDISSVCMSVQPEDVPVMFCGDLNCLPRSLTYRFLQTASISIQDVRAYDGIHPPPSQARQSADALPGLFSAEDAVQEGDAVEAEAPALPEGAVRVNPDNPFIHASADVARLERAEGERRWREGMVQNAGEGHVLSTGGITGESNGENTGNGDMGTVPCRASS